MTNFFLHCPQQDKYTLFNLLPTGLSNDDYFLDIATFLPANSGDLSTSWVRPQYLFKSKPMINYFDSEDVNNIIKQDILDKNQCVIYSNEDEIFLEFIKSQKSKNKTIFLHNQNKPFLDEFPNVTHYNINNYTKEEITNLLMDDLVESYIGNRDFNGNIIESNKYPGNKKSFLPNYIIGNDLLCKGNELVFSFLRNGGPKFDDKVVSSPSDKSYIKNVEMAYNIWSEKYLDMLLAALDNNVKILEIYENKFVENCKYFLVNYPYCDESEKTRLYAELNNSIREYIKKVPLNIAILIPSINDVYKGNLLEYFLNSKPHLNRAKLRKAIQDISQGGRRIYYDPSDKEFSEVAAEIARTRLLENRFLTSLVGLFCSRSITPILKTETAPSVLFEKIRRIRASINIRVLSGAQLSSSQFRTIGEQINSLKWDLRNTLPEQYNTLLSDSQTLLITLFSDLPVELSYYRNNLSLCQFFPVTRIPITPISAMINYYDATNIPFIEMNFDVKDVLVLNSIPVDDDLYFEFELFQEVCEKIGLKFNFINVNSSKDFISSINSMMKNIVIYYGHAAYDDAEDVGYLVFKEDKLSYKELKDIVYIPKILFLVGCETASCAAFSHSLSGGFLNKGVNAILATLFPIPPDHAATFIGRTLAFIQDPGVGHKLTLSSYVYSARKLGWQYDVLDALQRSSIITPFDRLMIMKESTDILMKLYKEREKDPKLDEAIIIHEQIFKRMGIMNDYDNIKSNIINYSLFFTLLGDGHNIFI